MRGLNVMYDFVRRPSMAFYPNYVDNIQQNPQMNPTSPSLSVPLPSESPMTPMPENYEIDDEFNLPISVAITMLMAYMIFGAAFYNAFEEEWSFFGAFYFVFISISTIGKVTKLIWSKCKWRVLVIQLRFRWLRAIPSCHNGGVNHLSHLRSRSHVDVHQCGAIEVERPL